MTTPGDDGEAERIAFNTALDRLRRALEKLARTPSAEVVRELEEAREEAYRLHEIVEKRSRDRNKQVVTAPAKAPMPTKAELLERVAQHLRDAADLLLFADEVLLSTALEHYFIQAHNKSRREAKEEEATP